MDSENINKIQRTSSESSSNEPGKLNFQYSDGKNNNMCDVSSSNEKPKQDTELLGPGTGSGISEEENISAQMSCSNTIKWSNVSSNSQYSLPTLPTQILNISKKQAKSKKFKTFAIRHNLRRKSRENISKFPMEEQEYANDEMQEEYDTDENEEKCEDVINYNKDTNSTCSQKTTERESEEEAIKNAAGNIYLDWSKTPSPSFSTSPIETTSHSENTKKTITSTDQMSQSDFNSKIEHFNNLSPNSTYKFKKYECPWAKSSFRSNKTGEQHLLRTPNSFIHQVMHGDFNGNLNKMPTSTQTEENANSANNKKEPSSSTSKMPSSTQTPSSRPKVPSSTQTPTISSNIQSSSEHRNFNQKVSSGSTTPCSYEKLNFNFSNLIKQNFIGNTELNYLGSGIVQASDDLFLESHYYLMINIPALDTVFNTMYLKDNQTEQWKNDYEINKTNFTNVAKNRIYNLNDSYIKDKSSTSEVENIPTTSYCNIKENSGEHSNIQQELSTEKSKPITPKNPKKSDVIHQIKQEFIEKPINWSNEYEQFVIQDAIVIPDTEDEIIIISETDLPNQTLELTKNISYKDCMKNQGDFNEKKFENIPEVDSSYLSASSSMDVKKKLKKQNKLFVKSNTIDSAPVTKKATIYDTQLPDNWSDIPLDPEDILDPKIKTIEKTESKSDGNWFTRMFSKKKKQNLTDVSKSYFDKLPNPKKIRSETKLASVSTNVYKCAVYPPLYPM